MLQFVKIGQQCDALCTNTCLRTARIAAYLSLGVGGSGTHCVFSVQSGRSQDDEQKCGNAPQSSRCAHISLQTVPLRVRPVLTVLECALCGSDT